MNDRYTSGLAQSAHVPQAPAGFGAALAALCTWAARCRAEDLPTRVRARARWVLADDLAAMVAAMHEPEVERYVRLVTSRSRSGEASIIAPGLPRADRFQAASANAMAASWCELDEGFRRTTCHAGLYVIPALLAEAEVTALTLADVLRALALGYECVARMALCFRFARPAVHAHALWSAIGASAAIGIARRFSAADLAGAIAAAATVASPGPRPHLVEGVLVRNAWAAAGAVAGIQCADWSQCGIQGGDSSTPAVFGNIFGASEDAGALVRSLGEDWALDAGYHKLYACCQHGHSAIEAILRLLGDRAIEPSTIDSIDVHTHPLGLGLDNADPHTTLAAKFSMPHMVAAALVYRSGGADAFSKGALGDERVRRLRSRVRLHPWDRPLAPPEDRPARVRITCGDTEYVAECMSAAGGPDRPLAADVLLDKIRHSAAPLLPGLASLVVDDAAFGDPASTTWSDVLEAIARSGA